MAADIFLVFDGASGVNSLTVEGETADSVLKDKKAIELMSFSWGVSNPVYVGQGSGMGAGKASFSDLTVSKYVDNATAALGTACATGDHFPKVELYARRSGGKQNNYVVYTMTEVFISSVSMSGSGGDVAMESVSLAYATIQVDYYGQDATGAIATTPKTFTYKLKENTV